jgi:hypothetical protein
MMAAIDIVEVDILRRQGDVSGTLVYIAPNGVPANVGGWTFTFSVAPGGILQTVSWIATSGNATGLQMTTVDASGFTVPGYNSDLNIAFVSTNGMASGMFLFIPGWGVAQIQQVSDASHAIMYNSAFPGNTASGTIAAGTPVFCASNVGYTVLVIPSTITDWNSAAPLSPTRSTGRFQYYLKYDTTDPSPGPYKKTFYQGLLTIFSQNDPTA